jgi:opacity protein-like surface antigen
MAAVQFDWERRSSHVLRNIVCRTSTVAITGLGLLFATTSVFGQHPHYARQGGPGGPDCRSCQNEPYQSSGYSRQHEPYAGDEYGGYHADSYYDDRYDASGGYHEGGGYYEDGACADFGGCDCPECVGSPHRLRRPLRRFASRLDTVPGGAIFGRPGNVIEPPYIDGECGDCNWGPVYLSIFAGVAFIDNFDSRFTFNNGMMNMLGVQETGFTTLDGVAAGGAIGRYFYRQARVEFEYTFRENGIGDMTEFTFSDDLRTARINDTLINSVVTGADGNMESNSFIWNIVADLRPRTVGCLNGYLGGGIGVLYVDSDIATATATFDINDTSFAYQGLAGINYPIRDRIDLFTEYRYLGANNIDVQRTDMMGTVSLGAFRFDSHSLVFGMRFLR